MTHYWEGALENRDKVWSFWNYHPGTSLKGNSTYGLVHLPIPIIWPIPKLLKRIFFFSSPDFCPYLPLPSFDLSCVKEIPQLLTVSWKSQNNTITHLESPQFVLDNVLNQIMPVATKNLPLASHHAENKIPNPSMAYETLHDLAPATSSTSTAPLLLISILAILTSLFLKQTTNASTSNPLHFTAPSL